MSVTPQRAPEVEEPAEQASIVVDFAWHWDDEECVPIERRQVLHVYVPVEETVLALAFEKIKGERRTLEDLRAGEKLADVFARYGIL